MTKAIIALLVSIAELIILWTGSNLDITEQWVETSLMVLNPLLVFFIPNDWLTRRRSNG